ncbi:MAG: MBL fold metallo-hydrolase [Candidatus Korarchaeota archaeon]
MFAEVNNNLIMAYTTMPGRYLITYVIVNDESSVLIDPAKELMDDVASILKIKNLKMEDIKGVLVTHGHGHHWSGISRLKAKAEIYVPPCEVFKDPRKAYEIYGFHATSSMAPLKEYIEVRHGGKIKVGREEFISFYTGGHSIDHYIYIHVGSGMLFAGSIVGEFVESHFKFFIDKSGSYENRQKFFEAIIGAKIFGICPGHTFPVHGDWKDYIRESYRCSKRVCEEVQDIAKKLKRFKIPDILKELQFRLGFTWSAAENTEAQLTTEAILKYLTNSGLIKPISKSGKVVEWEIP